MCCDTHQKRQGMTFEELLDRTIAELKSEYEQVKAMHDSMRIDRQTEAAQFQSTESLSSGETVKVLQPLK